MAISLVTGFAGQAHVTPAQDGAGYAGIVGTGCYVTKTGRMLAASMSTANKCVVCDGDAWMYGRHVRIEAGTTEELTVQSGSQGTKRNDLVVVRYAKDASTGVETASLVVVKGTAGTTATDPTYSDGSILDGTSPVDMPLYRIPIDGITAGTPVPLFSVLAPMSELQDSISRTLLWSGSSGKLGSLPLSADPSRFSALELRYVDDDGLNRMAEVPPSGACGFGFTTTRLDTGVTYVKFVQGSVDGRMLNLVGQRVCQIGGSVQDIQVARIQAVYGAL